MVRAVMDDDKGLKVLYEPRKRNFSGTLTATVDIVAIHGIGAHPDDTWTKNIGAEGSPRHVNWLSDRDMLPSVVPTARILRYGYESVWFGPLATLQKTSAVAQRLLRCLKRERYKSSKRPLIFIAHCFGGLVVLKALLDAKDASEEWPGIFASTSGLVFLGTPFRGAEGMSQTEMLAAAYRECNPDQVQPEVLKILEPGNEFLQDLIDKFGKTRKAQHKAQVACFYELKPSNVGTIVGGGVKMRILVTESSGCLDLSESIVKISLSRNHFNMNKFEKRSEEDFQAVCDELEKMAKNAPGSASYLGFEILEKSSKQFREGSPRMQRPDNHSLCMYSANKNDDSDNFSELSFPSDLDDNGVPGGGYDPEDCDEDIEYVSEFDHDKYREGNGVGDDSEDEESNVSEDEEDTSSEDEEEEEEDNEQFSYFE